MRTAKAGMLCKGLLFHGWQLAVENKHHPTAWFKILNKTTKLFSPLYSSLCKCCSVSFHYNEPQPWVWLYAESWESFQWIWYLGVGGGVGLGFLDTLKKTRVSHGVVCALRRNRTPSSSGQRSRCASEIRADVEKVMRFLQIRNNLLRRLNQPS